MPVRLLVLRPAGDLAALHHGERSAAIDQAFDKLTLSIRILVPVFHIVCVGRQLRLQKQFPAALHLHKARPVQVCVVRDGHTAPERQLRAGRYDKLPRFERLPDDAAAGRMGDEDNLRRGRHGYGAVRFDGGRQFQNNCAARFHGGLQRRPVRNGDGVSFRAMGKAGNAHCQEQRHTEKYDCRSFSHFVSPISSPFPIHSFLDGTKKTSARMRAGRMLSHRISRDGARCPSSSL